MVSLFLGNYFYAFSIYLYQSPYYEDFGNKNSDEFGFLSKMNHLFLRKDVVTHICKSVVFRYHSIEGTAYLGTTVLLKKKKIGFFCLFLVF